MTTYAEFQEYYLREIWREGDAALQADLPKLIRKAEARIKRDLKAQGLTGTVTLTSTTDNKVALPGDFGEAVAVSINGIPSSVVAGSNINALTASTGAVRGGCFAIRGGYLYANGTGTVDIPLDVKLVYQMGLVPYADEPVAPFYDQNPDFYTTVLNIYVYEYLRDLEMKAANDASYATLLESMERDSNYAKYPSGLLPGVFPANIV